MLVAVAITAAYVALAAVLCVGAFLALAGSIVAVIAGPEDRPIVIPLRIAGLLGFMLGLTSFVGALLVILASVPA